MKLPLILASLYFLAHPAFSQSPADALRRLGATLKEQNGAPVEVQAKAGSFTEADYRLLGQCTTLRKLSLDGKTLNDTTLPLLAGLKELEELSTNQTTLTDEGYRHFAQFPKLRVLHLWHPSWAMKEFTGAGIAHLKALPKLERLTFAGSTAGDAALEAIGQLTQLRSFQTWHTAQTQAGNADLAKLPLVSLKIGQRLPRSGAKSPPSFDAATIPVLAQIKSLETLELFEARLTAAALEPLKTLPNLKKLSIHTTDIPAADIETLRAAMPTVTIDFKPLTDEDREATLVKKLKM